MIKLETRVENQLTLIKTDGSDEILSEKYVKFTLS